MLIGYMRVSKADGSQALDLQRDTLLDAGIDPQHLYEDHASGKRDDRPGLAACLKALREGDTLVVWKLDRLGRDLRHLVNLIHDLTGRGVGLKVLTGHGAAIDTSTAAGKLVFGIFAALAEFERELIAERTRAGLASARARGRSGGRPYKMTAAKLRLAMAAMGRPETKVGELCQELGITRQTLYRHVDPSGALRPDGEKLLTGKPVPAIPRRPGGEAPDEARYHDPSPAYARELCRKAGLGETGLARELGIPLDRLKGMQSDRAQDVRMDYPTQVALERLAEACAKPPYRRQRVYRRREG